MSKKFTERNKLNLTVPRLSSTKDLHQLTDILAFITSWLAALRTLSAVSRR